MPSAFPLAVSFPGLFVTYTIGAFYFHWPGLARIEDGARNAGSLLRIERRSILPTREPPFAPGIPSKLIKRITLFALLPQGASFRGAFQPFETRLSYGSRLPNIDSA